MTFYVNNGISRLILGSVALKNPDLVKEAVKELRQTSPKGKRGTYAKSWAMKVEKKKTVVVYNRQYRLTHVLEHGHKTRKTHGRYGSKSETLAREHIAPVADSVADKFPEKINEYLKIK